MYNIKKIIVNSRLYSSGICTMMEMNTKEMAVKYFKNLKGMLI